MSTENKETQKPEEAILKSISALLDETIAEVETLAKGEVSFSDLKLQPEENGGMPAEAGQSSDDFSGMKKEGMPPEIKEKIEGKKEDKEVEKAIPEALSEAKDAEEKKVVDDDKDGDHKEPDGDEDEEGMEKFMRMLGKAMTKMGFIQKSEEAPATEEKKEETKLEKSAEEPKVETKVETPEVKKVEEKKEEAKEDLMKAELKTANEKIEKLSSTIDGLNKKVEEMSKRPVSGRRSLTGLQPIAKSEDDKVGSQAEPLRKGEVIDKLLELQKSGDKRINSVLISKAELARTPEELGALVKGIV